MNTPYEGFVVYNTYICMQAQFKTMNTHICNNIVLRNCNDLEK